MMHTLGRYTRALLRHEAPWLLDPEDAAQLGVLPWLAACAFNHDSAYTTFVGFTNYFSPLGRFARNSPDTSWVPVPSPYL